MSDDRKIARVVFTPTGERRPAKVGEWYQCGDGAFWCRVAEASLTDLDIYTREVFYAPQAPLNEAGQAEPPTVDLREIMLNNTSDSGLQYILGNIIDRLEADDEEQRAVNKDIAEMISHIHVRLGELEEVRDRQVVVMGDEE